MSFRKGLVAAAMSVSVLLGGLPLPPPRTHIPQYFILGAFAKTTANMLAVPPNRLRV